MSNRNLSRRGFVKTALAGSTAAVLMSNPLFAAQEARKPNIILFMADDVGYECFGCYGSKQYKTPRIDRMARKGVRFTNCHSTPLCTPSRVKIMTGRDNVRNYMDFGVFPKGEVCFSQILKKKGYETCFSGKWQLEGGGLNPENIGFDQVCKLDTKGSWPRYWKTDIKINGKRIPRTPGSYGPDVFTEFVVDFIRKKRAKPFLVYFPMTLVHYRFPPTPHSEERNSKNEQSNFEDMVNYMDTCVGKIVDVLKETNLADNSVVMFTGDNGTRYNITSYLDGKKIVGGKSRTTDYGTHVPLVVTGSKAPQNTVCEDLIDFSDFLPTLTDIANADLPKNIELDGRSFWPQCQGQKGNPREWLFNYYFPRPYSKTYRWYGSHKGSRWVRTTRYKLYSDGRMFDTVQDTEEKTPIRKNIAVKIRSKLQTILDSMPSKSPSIDYSKTH